MTDMREKFEADINKAIGGTYILPDGRGVWLDAVMVAKIIERIMPVWQAAWNARADAEAVDEIARLRKIIERAMDALQNTPQDPSVDVIWFDKYTTLYDFLSSALDPSLDQQVLPLPHPNHPEIPDSSTVSTELHVLIDRVIHQSRDDKLKLIEFVRSSVDAVYEQYNSAEDILQAYEERKV